MTETVRFARDTAVGLAVSLITTSATAAWVVSTEPSPAELLARSVAEREGPHAEAPPPPPPDPPPAELDCDDGRGAGSLRPSPDAEAAWLREMRAAEVPDVELPAMWGQIYAESRFDPCAVSPVGAAGLAQGMPRTVGQEFPRLDPPCDPEAVHDPACGARFQAAYMRRIRGWLPVDARTDELNLASYNAGAGAVKRRVEECRDTPHCNPSQWPTIEPHMPAETRRYVSAIADYSADRGFTARGEFRLAF